VGVGISDGSQRVIAEQQNAASGALPFSEQKPHIRHAKAYVMLVMERFGPCRIVRLTHAEEKRDGEKDCHERTY